VLYLGKLVETGTRDEICDSPQHPYTQALIAAVPTIEPGQHALAAPAGEAPSPLEPPSGCPFRTRCPRASDICAGQEPALEQTGPTHAVACYFPGTQAGTGTRAGRPARQETTT
jgi:oligopeptide/dipeptide ABC transporter ATP-binding protein